MPRVLVFACLHCCAVMHASGTVGWPRHCGRPMAFYYDYEQYR